VVGALERAAVAAAQDDGHPAMTADAREDAQRAGFVPHRYQRLAQQLERQVVAGLRELVHAGHAQPVAAEDALFLAGVDGGVPIPARRQRLGGGERRPRRAGGGARHAAPRFYRTIEISCEPAPSISIVR
jgi:hypothetical protein